MTTKKEGDRETWCVLGQIRGHAPVGKLNKKNSLVPCSSMSEARSRYIKVWSIYHLWFNVEIQIRNTDKTL